MDMNMSFNCSICCKKDHAGTTVFSLTCGHSFHRRCIAEYFQSPIRATEVHRRKCPDCQNNTPTTPIKSIGIVQPCARRAMMTPESPINDRRPFGVLTNTPSPRRRYHEVQNIYKREFNLIEDTDNDLHEPCSSDSPEFQRVGPSVKTDPIPIPVVQAPAEPAPRLHFRKPTFLLDPDAENLPLEERLQRFRDRVKAEPVFTKKVTK